MDLLDIADLAKTAGVTSRTLRHYDAIGLLTPAHTRADGRRAYGEAEVIRLHHILVLRALDVPLPTIASIVTGDPRATAAHLRGHHAALLERRDHFDRLASTVQGVIDHLDSDDNLGVTMPASSVFDGFDHAAYEPEARERWGAPVDASTATWTVMSPHQRETHMADHAQIGRECAALAAAGANPAGDEAQALVARHYAWVCAMWTPDAESYASLAALYLEDARFRATYEDFGPGTAAFLHDAMVTFAPTLAAGGEG